MGTVEPADREDVEGTVTAFGDATHYGDAPGTDPFMLAAVPS